MKGQICDCMSYGARLAMVTTLLFLMVGTSDGARDKPYIRAIRPEAKGGVSLEIVPVGEPGEMIDVFVTDSLIKPNWRPAATYLRAGAAPRIVWAESETSEEMARMRFFRIGRADIDLNENGIPDAREALYHVHDLPSHARARWARAGLPGPPPSFSNVLNVKNFGARGDGISDDTSAIVQAISQAPPNSVVYLPAGVYRVTQALYLKSNMILRGDGPALSSLIFEGQGTAGRAIGILRWDSQQSSSYVTVTEGMERESTVVGVSNVNGFAPGDIVEMEEDNDFDWGLNEAWQQRLVGQINRVVAVHATEKRLTLDRHLRHTFKPERNPRLRKLNTIDNVGVENLFLQRKDAVNGYTIEMKYAVNAWVHNVESFKTYKAHLWMDRSYECDVRDSYFHDSHVFGGGGQGYGVGCGRHTSDSLIENNIFRLLRHSMIVGIGANGNVYGYNYSRQRAICPMHGTRQPDISVHGNYVFMNLFEGNVLEDAYAPDWYWPAGPGNTLFRNVIDDHNTAISVGSDRQNLMGNVLPHGSIAMTSGLEGVVDYGNVRNGNYENVYWPGCPCRNLPDSLYRSVPPDFMLESEEFAWPPIGPDMEGATNPLIPAEKRFLTGET